MSRENISSGSKYEPIVGYSRAVKVGQMVFVSGTTSATPEGFIGAGDPYLQTKQILKTIETALKKAGTTMDAVVRTRVFTTNIAAWEEIGRAHGEVFGNNRPANTMVEVSKLISPEMLVEIEADAVIV